MRNAWHFYYALNLVVKVVCGGFGIALDSQRVAFLLCVEFSG
ncbi:hypothetical protein B4U81_15430 [Vibrio campbellii]|nr:hypothetical protein B4U81_15430 [Vibrio campbellii]